MSGAEARVEDGLDLFVNAKHVHANAVFPPGLRRYARIRGSKFAWGHAWDLGPPSAINVFSSKRADVCALLFVFCRHVEYGVFQGRVAQLAAERSEAAAAAKRGLEDNVRLEKQLVDARRKVRYEILLQFVSVFFFA